MYLEEMGWEGMGWIHLTQGPVAGFCEHGNEPLGKKKGIS
jgi:hypothetical protein